MKLQKLGGTKNTSGSKNIKITTNITLDYTKLCYALEVSSEQKIVKIVLRGNITMMEEP